MSKTYRTAMGKTIDMGSMVLANENVRAIGNQKVNARGDIIDSNNNVVKTRQQQLAEQYSTQGKKQNRPTNVQKPRAEKPAEAIKSKEPLPAPVCRNRQGGACETCDRPGSSHSKNQGN